MLFQDPSCPGPSRSWLDLPPGTTAAWSGTTQPDAILFHLNLRGEAEIEDKAGSRFLIHPNSLWVISGPPDAVKRSVRMPGRESHSCLSLVFPRSWFLQLLERSGESPPGIWKTLFSESRSTALKVHHRPLELADVAWAQGLMPEHLCLQARALLDSLRLSEFFLREVFSLPSHGQATSVAGKPVSRTERLARERIDQAKSILLSHLDQPLDLKTLAASLACNPHHLSRTFARIEGTPMSLWLRRERINRAAELIASGRCNVSEASLEVGYQSFSHFSRAFLQEKGVQPSKWVQQLSRD